MSEHEKRSDPWVYVMGGVLAVLVAPHLVAIAAGSKGFFLALSFGALVGACDAARADDDMEAALRTAGGLAFGLVIGVALLLSTLLAGLVFGAAVVASRWAWLDPARRAPHWAAVGAFIAASGMWLIPPEMSFSIGGGLSAFLPAFFWGLTGGLGAMTIEMPGLLQDERAEAEQLKPTKDEAEPACLPDDVDGSLGANIQPFPRGRRCQRDA